MLFRAFIFLLGFGFTISGGVTLIFYLNLIPMGNNFKGYLYFIATRPECYLFLLGIFLITSSLYYKGKKNKSSL